MQTMLETALETPGRKIHESCIYSIELYPGTYIYNATVGKFRETVWFI